MSVRLIVAGTVTYLVLTAVFADLAKDEGWPVLLTPLILVLPLAFVVGMVAMWVWAVQ